jgi:hypothetical protein
MMAINVVETCLCIAILNFDVLGPFNLGHLHPPLHTFLAWSIFQIVKLLQIFLDVQ